MSAALTAATQTFGDLEQTIPHASHGRAQCELSTAPFSNGHIADVRCSPHPVTLGINACIATLIEDSCGILRVVINNSDTVSQTLYSDLVKSHCLYLVFNVSQNFKPGSPIFASNGYNGTNRIIPSGITALGPSRWGAQHSVLHKIFADFGGYTPERHKTFTDFLRSVGISETDINSVFVPEVTLCGRHTGKMKVRGPHGRLLLTAINGYDGNAQRVLKVMKSRPGWNASSDPEGYKAFFDLTEPRPAHSELNAILAKTEREMFLEGHTYVVCVRAKEILVDRIDKTAIPEKHTLQHLQHTHTCHHSNHRNDKHPRRHPRQAIITRTSTQQQRKPLQRQLKTPYAQRSYRSTRLPIHSTRLLTTLDLRMIASPSARIPNKTISIADPSWRHSIPCEDITATTCTTSYASDLAAAAVCTQQHKDARRPAAYTTTIESTAAQPRKDTLLPAKCKARPPVTTTAYCRPMLLRRITRATDATAHYSASALSHRVHDSDAAAINNKNDKNYTIGYLITLLFISATMLIRRREDDELFI